MATGNADTPNPVCRTDSCTEAGVVKYAPPETWDAGVRCGACRQLVEWTADPPQPVNVTLPDGRTVTVTPGPDYVEQLNEAARAQP